MFYRNLNNRTLNEMRDWSIAVRPQGDTQYTGSDLYQKMLEEAQLEGRSWPALPKPEIARAKLGQAIVNRCEQFGVGVSGKMKCVALSPGLLTTIGEIVGVAYYYGETEEDNKNGARAVVSLIRGDIRTTVEINDLMATATYHNTRTSTISTPTTADSLTLCFLNGAIESKGFEDNVMRVSEI